MLRQRLRNLLASQYEDLLAVNAQANGRAGIPTPVERFFVSLTGYEYLTAIRRFVGDGQRVLVIGDGGARDYYSLRQLGKDVTVLDIAKQQLIPDLVIGDVQEELPFPDARFDAVIMAEVTEHLFEDVRALNNVRRVLRDDGALILTVPFLNDEPEYHARIHTAPSLRRLLEHAGWRVTDWEFKGGGFAWVDTLVAARILKHGVNFVAWRTRGEPFYEGFNRWLARVDRRWGRRDHWVHRRSPYYGAFVRAEKGTAVDFAAVNREEFTDYQVG